jgi:hypothetical protein
MGFGAVKVGIVRIGVVEGLIEVVEGLIEVVGGETSLGAKGIGATDGIALEGATPTAFLSTSMVTFGGTGNKAKGSDLPFATSDTRLSELVGGNSPATSGTLFWPPGMSGLGTSWGLFAAGVPGTVGVGVAPGVVCWAVGGGEELSEQLPNKRVSIVADKVKEIFCIIQYPETLLKAN